MGTMLREETAPTMPHIKTLLLGGIRTMTPMLGRARRNFMAFLAIKYGFISYTPLIEI
jgi:hypothetical protein